MVKKKCQTPASQDLIHSLSAQFGEKNIKVVEKSLKS